jgi:hypothetical protein
MLPVRGWGENHTVPLVIFVRGSRCCRGWVTLARSTCKSLIRLDGLRWRLPPGSRRSLAIGTSFIQQLTPIELLNAPTHVLVRKLSESAEIETESNGVFYDGSLVATLYFAMPSLKSAMFISSKSVRRATANSY